MLLNPNSSSRYQIMIDRIKMCTHLENVTWASQVLIGCYIFEFCRPRVAEKWPLLFKAEPVYLLFFFKSLNIRFPHKNND